MRRAMERKDEGSRWGEKWRFSRRCVRCKGYMLCYRRRGSKELSIKVSLRSGRLGRQGYWSAVVLFLSNRAWSAQPADSPLCLVDARDPLGCLVSVIADQCSMSPSAGVHRSSPARSSVHARDVFVIAQSDMMHSHTCQDVR